MNKIRLIAILVSCISVYASAQDKMIIHLKDGQKVTFEMENVDHVELEAPNGLPTDKRDTIQGIGGTVASIVNLGTKVKWATHNLGASCMSQTGGRFNWVDSFSAANSWGEEWRLPSQEDWQELYEKCSWEWVTIDGICGRLIKASNGNTMFLPASGIIIDSQVHEVGSLGIYWSSDQAKGEIPVNAVGAYFDSANIYSMEFAKSNTLSIRLVKD